MRKILDRITYKVGYSFEIEPHENDFECGVPTTVPQEIPPSRLRVNTYAACTRSGQEEWQRGRWFYVKDPLDVTEVVRTAYQALYLFELHELQEQFKFDGVIVFDPHSMNLPDDVQEEFENG